MDKELYKNLWMSPNFMIDRMTLLVEKYGIDTILSNNKLKQEREAWVAAVFLLGLGEKTHAEYWLEINTEDGTPDIFTYFLEEIDGNNHRYILPLEIVDFEDHSESVISLIEKKVKKNYPPDFALIVYARKGGAEINYDKIYEDTQKLSVPFREIWILSATSYDNDYHLVLIYPRKLKIVFNVHKEYEKHKNQGPLGTFLKRGTGTDPEFLGVKEVPLPKIT